MQTFLPRIIIFSSSLDPIYMNREKLLHSFVKVESFSCLYLTVVKLLCSKNETHFNCWHQRQMRSFAPIYRLFTFSLSQGWTLINKYKHIFLSMKKKNKISVFKLKHIFLLARKSRTSKKKPDNRRPEGQWWGYLLQDSNCAFHSLSV